MVMKEWQSKISFKPGWVLFFDYAEKWEKLPFSIWL